MTSNYITHASAIDLLSWEGSVAALRAGHLAPKAEIADMFLGPQTATLLNRAAFIDGLGYGVKAVTVMGDNPAKGLPTVQGATTARISDDEITVFENGDGAHLDLMIADYISGAVASTS